MSAAAMQVWIEGIASLASLGAFAIAIWVFIDSNRIKKVEQLALHYRMWAEFHQIEIDTGFLDKWGEYYTLRFDETRFDGREHVVTYAILNLLRVSWTMCQEKVLHTSAQQEEVFNYFYSLRGKREFLIGQIALGGYDPSFYILACDVMVDDRAKAHATFVDSLRRGWATRVKRTRRHDIDLAYGRSADPKPLTGPISRETPAEPRTRVEETTSTSAAAPTT